MQSEADLETATRLEIHPPLRVVWQKHEKELPARRLQSVGARCRMHGGTSPGAPLGNTNALKTGEHTRAAITARKEETKFFRDIYKNLQTLTDLIDRAKKKE